MKKQIRLTRTQSELERIIADAQLELQALKNQKVQIYDKLPKDGELYYFYDRMSNKVVFWTCNSNTIDKIRFDRVPLHKTSESANMEKNFWVEAYNKRKEFKIDEENCTFNCNVKEKYVTVIAHKTYAVNNFYFNREDAEELLSKFGRELICKAFFNLN